MSAAVEKSTMHKVYWRLLPISILTYFLCYLDRINVGFAALTMNKDLGLDAATYGLAAGTFFWGYFLFEVPSNMILEKVGARMWIARIMVSWGLLSGATAFCVGPWSFLTMRFLLGLAEAGLFPGMILFFTYWFPDWHRARIVSAFMVALPAAVAAGSPVSTALLSLNGLGGLAGWQWMYIAEATPTVLVGLFFFFAVTDRPAEAKWLSDEERNWLIGTLETERALIESKRKMSVWQSFWDPKVLLLTLNYFGIVSASLGMLLFLPQMVKTLGPHQYASRLGEHDPVYLWRVRPGGLGLAFRPHGRTALEPVLRQRGGDYRFDHRGTDHRHRLGDRRHVDCGYRTLRLERSVLDDAVDDPDRDCRSIRYRLDQLPSAIWAASSARLAVGWTKDYTGNFTGGLYALAGFRCSRAHCLRVLAHLSRSPCRTSRSSAGVPAE